MAKRKTTTTAVQAMAIPTMAPMDNGEGDEDDDDLDSEGRLVCAAANVVVVTERVEEMVVEVVVVVADVVEVGLCRSLTFDNISESVIFPALTLISIFQWAPSSLGSIAGVVAPVDTPRYI